MSDQGGQISELTSYKDIAYPSEEGSQVEESSQSERAGACGGAPRGGHVRVTSGESSETVASHTRGSAVGRAREGTSRPVFVILSSDS